MNTITYDVYRIFEHYFEECLRDDLSPYPSVIEQFNELKEGWNMVTYSVIEPTAIYRRDAELIVVRYKNVSNGDRAYIELDVNCEVATMRLRPRINYKMCIEELINFGNGIVTVEF